MASMMDQKIQDDWTNREFIELIAANIKRIADFLNKFDVSTRHQLAKLNEKLSSLERNLDFMEAKIGTQRQSVTLDNNPSELDV